MIFFVVVVEEIDGVEKVFDVVGCDVDGVDGVVEFKR